MLFQHEVHRRRPAQSQEASASAKAKAALSEFPPVRYWQIIADNLKQRGWSWGCVSAIDTQGRTIWIAGAHRDGKRFVVRADEILTAFVQLETAIWGCGFFA
jgi:hypothetical protein